MDIRPDPLMDGVTHINVYSRGATELGRMLTNFAPIGFTHPKYGVVASVEGFWYWLKTGKIHNHLLEMVGAEAKAAGKKYPTVVAQDFEKEIKLALRLKVMQNENLMQKMVDSNLPFLHYYVAVGPLDKHTKVFIPKGGAFVINELERIRKELKSGFFI